MQELRCINCGRLLGVGTVVYFETKCTRCKALIAIKDKQVKVIALSKQKRNN